MEKYRSNRKINNKSVDLAAIFRTPQQSIDSWELSKGGSYSNIGELHPSIFLSEEKIVQKMRKIAAKKLMTKDCSKSVIVAPKF